MNSQVGESLSGFWALYFSFSPNTFIQMKQLKHLKEHLHIYERQEDSPNIAKVNPRSQPLIHDKKGPGISTLNSEDS